jgi:hypothetical protein
VAILEAEMIFPDISVVAFTGTREGLNADRRTAIAKFLKNAGNVRLAAHGMAKGADTDFDAICEKLCIKREGYPASEHSIRFVKPQMVYPVKPPLERDWDIVKRGQLLIAAPPTDKEVLRSGSWATMRYNAKLEKPLVHFLLDGSYLLYEKGSWK